MVLPPPPAQHDNKAKTRAQGNNCESSMMKESPAVSWQTEAVVRGWWYKVRRDLRGFECPARSGQHSLSVRSSAWLQSKQPQSPSMQGTLRCRTLAAPQEGLNLVITSILSEPFSPHLSGDDSTKQAATNCSVVAAAAVMSITCC